MALDLKEQVTTEQIKTMHSQIIPGVVSGYLAAILFVWVFRNDMSHLLLTGWLILMNVVMVVRLRQYFLFSKQLKMGIAFAHWETIFTNTVLAYSCLWSVALIMMIYQGKPIHLAICAIWIMGISGSMVTGYSAHLKILLAGFIPIIFPGAILMLYIGGDYGLTIGLALIIYAYASLKIVRPINKSIISAITLNFQLEEEVRTRKIAEEKLLQLAIVDGLTGLYNRRHFDAALKTELAKAKRSSSPFSIVLIDIDYFKPFNDNYGHQEGDECLQQVATAIKAAIKRPSDQAFRYGGEEMIIILPDTNAENAFKIAETLRINIQNLNIPHQATQLTDTSVVTISAGVASLPPTHEATPADIISQADKALYKAKQRGRNRIVASK